MARRNHKTDIQRRRVHHAINRALQRYEVTLTGADLAAIRRKIQNGQVISSQRQTNSRTIHTVGYLDRIFTVVYSTKDKQILTCLPVEEGIAMDHGRGRE